MTRKRTSRSAWWMVWKASWREEVPSTYVALAAISGPIVGGRLRPDETQLQLICSEGSGVVVARVFGVSRVQLGEQSAASTGMFQEWPCSEVGR